MPQHPDSGVLPSPASRNERYVRPVPRSPLVAGCVRAAGPVERTAIASLPSCSASSSHHPLSFPIVPFMPSSMSLTSCRDTRQVGVHAPVLCPGHSWPAEPLCPVLCALCSNDRVFLAGVGETGLAPTLDPPIPVSFRNLHNGQDRERSLYRPLDSIEH